MAGVRLEQQCEDDQKHFNMYIVHCTMYIVQGIRNDKFNTCLALSPGHPITRSGYQLETGNMFHLSIREAPLK